MVFPVIPVIKDLKNFLDKTKNNFEYKTNLVIDYEIKDFQKKIIYDLLNLSMDFFYNIDFEKQIHRSEVKFDFSSNVLTLKAYREESFLFINNKSDVIKEALINIGLKDIKIATEDLRQNLVKDAIEQQISQEFETFLSKPKETKSELERVNERKNRNSYFKYKIDEIISSEEKNFIVEATIFSIELISTKTDLVIVNMLISD